ncbi:uncharacterized protein LOC122655236 [Telopea speciosissima]|uniref:uncharacterized protein LOC122655236 n=1 Tax=Telopea speciosissima TaxID=54955 RepID=UPI001CC4F7AB|nr:uncharacterized protein LOC122655236 [Telopea speciosissima]
MEVYVDDMLVKSLKANDHIRDLDEAFQVLRKSKMRLNPAKCAFSVTSGKFLGFMVSKRGIEVNLTKIKAILEMRPPERVKELQELTGRIAALGRFILTSRDRCLPFFKALKNQAREREVKGTMLTFEWTEECQTVFTKLKRYLARPPLLTKPEPGDTLQLYLAVTTIALVAWSVELGEFDIQCKPRNAIKAQALADFVVECTLPEEEAPPREEPEELTEQWTLFVDGSSNVDGCDAGLILTSPRGFLVQYALRFEFQTTNNGAEYEALIARLKLAQSLMVRNIAVHSDSQLIVNQVKGEYEAKEPCMAQYLSRVHDLITKFSHFEILLVPRAQNVSADALLRLATSDFQDLGRTIYIDVLDTPSIEQPEEILPIEMEPYWMDPIVNYLQKGTLPADREEAKKVRMRAARYTMIGGILYKKAFAMPYLKCLRPTKAEYVLREIHEGICGQHLGGMALTHKVIRQGYFWPYLRKEAMSFVCKCLICEKFMPVTRQPAPGGRQFVVVAVDYFTKWVEVEALAVISVAKLRKTSIAHPQSNGLAKTMNKILLYGIKKKLETTKGLWVEELPNILWAYRTTTRLATGETPFMLAYGTEAIIPVEIGETSMRVQFYNPEVNDEELRINLNL